MAELQDCEPLLLYHGSKRACCRGWLRAECDCLFANVRLVVVEFTYDSLFASKALNSLVGCTKPANCCRTGCIGCDGVYISSNDQRYYTVVMVSATSAYV